MTNLTSLKCPSCGALIHIEPNKESCFCTYCGSQIQISDPNKKTVTYIDAARIKEAEVKENIRKRELELEDKSRQNNRIKEYLKYAIIAIAIIFLFLFLTNDDVQIALVLISVILIPVAGIVAIFYLLFK